MDRPTDQIDPSALLDDARKGDPQAVSRLLEHYRPYLSMLARLGASQRLQAKYDDSDLVQETLVQVQRDLSKFQGKTEQNWQPGCGGSWRTLAASSCNIIHGSAVMLRWNNKSKTTSLGRRKWWEKV